MTVSGCMKYVPLCTPALTDSSNKVDGKLLGIRLFIVALAAIGASAAAVYTKVNSRTIAKFIALPAACIVIADIASSFYAATHSRPQRDAPGAKNLDSQQPSSSSSSAPLSGAFPFKGVSLADALDEIMKLSEEERREAVYHRIAFNSDKWELCLGKGACAGEDRKIELSSLPQNIAEILNEPCPVFADKRVIDTHMLVRVPKTLGGQISVNSLGNLLKRFFPDTNSGYSYIWKGFVTQFGERTVEESYWALMLKEPLAGSGNKTYASQKEMVAALYPESSYQVPTLIDSITCLLAYYVGFEERLFKNDYMRVQEGFDQWGNHFQVVVGGVTRAGLYVHTYDYDDDRIVAGALRKFGP